MRTSYLSIVLPQREDLLESLVAIVANVVIHGHGTPPDEFRRILVLAPSIQSCDYFFSFNFTDA
jgi:hypothetical protein